MNNNLDRLIAKQDISELVYRYMRGLDRWDRDLLISLFHDDAWCEYGFFNGGAVQSRVKQSNFRHRAAKEQFERVARQTERQTRDAYLGVISEIARVKALGQALQSAQTALKATEAGFEVGTRTTVDVLDARRALFLAETQYARSRYDYLVNVLLLKQAAGTLTDADLREINRWLAASTAPSR